MSGESDSGWREASLGPGVIAGDGAAHDLQVQQRALAPRRGDGDAEQLDHPVGVELADLLQRPCPSAPRRRSTPRPARSRSRGRGSADPRCGRPSTRMCTPSSSPHSGLCSSASRSWGSSSPKLRGLLVVIEDVVAVEVVHRQSPSDLEPEHLAPGQQRVHERVDVGGLVVDADARARGRAHAQAAHQRLRAVVPGADAHARRGRPARRRRGDACPRS